MKFHSGREFTADDVIFTIQAMQREDVSSQLKHVALAIDDMKADDDHTVTLHLSHPVSNLFDMFEVMPIVDQDTFDDLLAGKQIIGTGPFKVVSYTPGSGVELERNDDYWVKDRPYLDGVDISVQSQSQSMLSSLKSGESQLALDMAPLDAVSVEDDPQFDVIESDADDSDYYVASNVAIPPLDQPEVRQGIAWAIDRDRILDQALGGIGQTSSLPWSPSSPAYDEEKAATYSHDLDKAKELIDGAGATGASVKVAYNAGFATNQAIAEIVQFNLKEAGPGRRAGAAAGAGLLRASSPPAACPGCSSTCTASTSSRRRPWSRARSPSTPTRTPRASTPTSTASSPTRSGTPREPQQADYDAHQRLPARPAVRQRPGGQLAHLHDLVQAPRRRLQHVRLPGPRRRLPDQVD